jgi:hypothetical protein
MFWNYLSNKTHTIPNQQRHHFTVGILQVVGIRIFPHNLHV